MKKYKFLKFFLLFVLLVSVFISGCNTDSKIKNATYNTSDKLQVYTTLYVLEEMSKKIGGEYVEVINIMPPGASPHDFQPSTKNVTSLMKSDIFVYNGVSLELWLDKVIENMSDSKVKLVNASSKINLISGLHNGHSNDHSESHGNEENYDPHVWLDPLNVLKQAETIKESFISVDSEHESTYEKNYLFLKEQLINLDKKYSSGLADFKNKKFFVSHAAFGYLAKRYEIEQYPITGLVSEDIPTTEELINIVNKIKALGVEYILLDTHNEVKIADVVADETGSKVAKIFTIASPTKEELDSGLDYFKMMEKNLEVLKLALK